MLFESCLKREKEKGRWAGIENDKSDVLQLEIRHTNQLKEVLKMSSEE